MDIKFFLTIKIPQHARIAIDFSKRQNQYGNYKASHTSGNTSQPSTHVLPSFRTVFCGHFHSDWKHSHTNYNLLVWGPGCCFLQDLTLGKFPIASRIWSDVQLSPLQLAWWWYADVFCKVAFGTYSCCGSCSCGRAGAKPQACWCCGTLFAH